MQWIRRFILFHNKQHPKEMGAAEIEAFLTYLAVQERVAASTQNQAFSALLFLYREVLRQELEDSIHAVRAKQPRSLPTVLTKAEVRSVLQHLSGVPRLVIQVLYGSGVRLNEGLNLRVKDLDFAQHQIIVRNPKGYESPVTMLPTSLVEPLKLHLEQVRRAHQQDLDRGYGSVHLPFALERKYPHAAKEWIWQFVFPAIGMTRNSRTNLVRRYHLHETGVQKALKPAVFAAGILQHLGSDRDSTRYFVKMLITSLELDTGKIGLQAATPA